MSDGVGWRAEARYAWVDGWNAFCVALVEATSPEGVLEKMVGGCGTGIVSVAKARKWASEETVPDHRSVIAAGILGGWVVTVEANGYQATLREVVRRMSEGSRAIVLFRNVHGHMRFLYAVDGVVVRSFDPLLYDDSTPWDGRPLPEESGLDFRSHPMAAALVCAERLTGLRLTPNLLDDDGDWVAVGHHPFHSLVGPGFWPMDEANAERLVCADDPRRRSIPNRLVSLPWSGDDDADDAVDLLLPGWIGWIQLLVFCIGLAGLSIQLIVAFEYVGDELYFPDDIRVRIAPFVLLWMLIPTIGRMLERVATSRDRTRKRHSSGRAKMQSSHGPS